MALKKKKLNWGKIEAEYLAGGISYRRLAEKYGISLKAVTNHAAKDNWITKKTQIENIFDNAVVQQISESKIDTATEFLKLVDGMIERVSAAIKAVDVEDAAALRQLTLALKDLRELKGLDKTDLDRQEQRARIDSYKARSQTTEKPSEINLIIEGGSGNG